MTHTNLLVVMSPGKLGGTLRNLIPHGEAHLLTGMLGSVDMRLEGPQLLQVSGTALGQMLFIPLGRMRE